jgi:endonuclease YncB( thermonuclease family)
VGLFLIKGTFHVKGYSPDGDSIRFRADDSSNWNLLGPGPLEINAKQHVQTRFQGIDALETHYSQGGAENHQPLDLARTARDFVLSELNITGVTWNSGETVVTAANDDVPGYVLARKKDIHGRPIVFAFPGVAPELDGTNVFVTAVRMQQSVNYGLLAAGHAYPFFFTNSGLFTELREAMTTAVANARLQGLGLYARDKTNTLLAITSTTEITDQEPLFPRLFRRLADFLEGNPPDLTGFLAFLAAQDTRVIVQSPFEETGFDNLLEVVLPHSVRLTEFPENLIFIE